MFIIYTIKNVLKESEATLLKELYGLKWFHIKHEFRNLCINLYQI